MRDVFKKIVWNWPKIAQWLVGGSAFICFYLWTHQTQLEDDGGGPTGDLLILMYSMILGMIIAAMGAGVGHLLGFMIELAINRAQNRKSP